MNKDHPSKEFMLSKLAEKFEIQPKESVAKNLSYGLGYITFKTSENLYYIFIADVFMDEKGNREKHPEPVDIVIEEFLEDPAHPSHEETLMTSDCVENYTLIGVNDDIERYNIEYYEESDIISIFHKLLILHNN